MRTICPEMMAYFASGVRPSMYDLALLHAAARCENVHVRSSDGARRFSRRPGEEQRSFHRRIVAGEAEGEHLLRALPRAADLGHCGERSAIVAALARRDL